WRRLRVSLNGILLWFGEWILTSVFGVLIFHSRGQVQRGEHLAVLLCEPLFPGSQSQFQTGENFLRLRRRPIVDSPERNELVNRHVVAVLPPLGPASSSGCLVLRPSQ